MILLQFYWNLLKKTTILWWYTKATIIPINFRAAQLQEIMLKNNCYNHIMGTKYNKTIVLYGELVF